MASKTAKFITIILFAACLILTATAPATADDGDTDVGVSVTVTQGDQEGDGGGGGGGGGGGARGITTLSESITPEGRLTKEIIAPSSDLKVYLTLPDGTYCTYGGTSIVSWLSIQALTDDDTDWLIPVDATRVSPVYEMDPDDATFAPPIKCTFKYKDSELPQGADENKLTIMRWRAVFKQWYALPSVVDPVNNLVTAEIDYFSLYTLMLVPRPATFELSQLEITPDEINTNEEVTASVLVTNTGDLSGNYEVVLKINNRTVEVRTVNVPAGESDPVSFKITQTLSGTYTIDINGLSGEILVRSPAAPEPETPEATEISTGPEAPTVVEPTTGPEITETTSEPELGPTREAVPDTGVEFRWWIFAGLFIILAALAILFWLVIKYQKA